MAKNPLLGKTPLLLKLLAGMALAVFVVPLLALLVRAPWLQMPSRLASPELLDALWLSFLTASIATGICVLLGVPLAWMLARIDFRGRRLVRALVTVPLIMPPVVAGVALLTAFGRNGIIGSTLLDVLGITIPFSTVAVVMAQTFVALPFLVITVEGTIRTTDLTYDEVASSSGATRWQTFILVNVPLAAPGIFGGAVLAWARALGEFGATITFAGNAPGVTRTMPLEIYTVLQTDPDAAIALSVILLAISITVLALLREKWLSGVTG